MSDNQAKNKQNEYDTNPIPKQQDIKQKNLKIKVYFNDLNYVWRYKQSNPSLATLQQFISQTFNININNVSLQYDDEENCRTGIQEEDDLNDAFICAIDENRKILKIYVIAEKTNNIEQKSVANDNTNADIQQSQNIPSAATYPIPPPSYIPIATDRHFRVDNTVNMDDNRAAAEYYNLSQNWHETRNVVGFKAFYNHTKRILILTKSNNDTVRLNATRSLAFIASYQSLHIQLIHIDKCLESMIKILSDPSSQANICEAALVVINHLCIQNEKTKQYEYILISDFCRNNKEAIDKIIHYVFVDDRCISIIANTLSVLSGIANGRKCVQDHCINAGVLDRVDTLKDSHQDQIVRSNADIFLNALCSPIVDESDYNDNKNGDNMDNNIAIKQQQTLMIEFERKKRIKFMVIAYINSLDIKSERIASTDSTVIDTIFDFFYLMDSWCLQYIDPKHITKAVISNHGQIVTISDELTIYSNNVVKRGEIHRFRIRLNSIGQSNVYGINRNEYEPYIGIIKDEPNILDKYKNQCNFHWNNDGLRFCGGNAIFHENTSIDKEYGMPFWKEMDEVEITVNLIDFTLSYTINGDDYGVVKNNIHQSDYRLAVAVFNTHAQFELF